MYIGAEVVELKWYTAVFGGGAVIYPYNLLKAICL
jgi:hypothetical protein